MRPNQELVAAATNGRGGNGVVKLKDQVFTFFHIFSKVFGTFSIDGFINSRKYAKFLAYERWCFTGNADNTDYKSCSYASDCDIPAKCYGACST